MAPAAMSARSTIAITTQEGMGCLLSVFEQTVTLARDHGLDHFRVRLALVPPVGGPAHGGLVTHREVRPRLARRADVLRAGAVQDLAGALDPIGVVAVRREQDASLADASFVSLGL